jgi:metal-sulfur cluster biosynthetic enzyme
MTPATDTDIREALRTVIDPELGVNIVDLGLVYRIDVEGPRVRVEMTMTSPACPMGVYLKTLVEAAINGPVPGVQHVEVRLVWEPTWDPNMMSDAGRRQLDGGRPR